MAVSHLVKSDYSSHTREELLRSSPQALLGVTPQAEEALRALGIHTVFDLATSRFFGNAAALANAEGSGGRFRRLNLVPSDVVPSEAQPRDVTLLAEHDVGELHGIGDRGRALLNDSLGVKTMRDMANWPPYAAARQIAEQDANIASTSGDDQIPGELVPRFNEYPTEKVFYSVYTIDDAPDDQKLVDLAGAIDLEIGLAPSRPHLSHVRKGYVVRFEQSWTPIGLALGNLLHSLALAPGESTRIAVVDWARRQGVRTDESITQLEALSNSIMQTRSINEVTRAVAREAQSGFSNLHSNATVSNNAYASYGLKNPQEALAAALAGAALGGAAGAGAGGLAGAGTGGVIGVGAGAGIGAMGAGVGAIPGAVLGGMAGMTAGTLIGAGAGGIIGATAGGVGAGVGAAQFGGSQETGSDTTVDVVSTTSTTGHRELCASMAQNILERTQQISNSCRDKRASIVQEISQSESEKITTRVVTNYNHMHSLTIQYFEVVQLYRVKVRAADAKRCLYIPVKPFRWSAALAEKYRAVLVRTALDYQAVLALSYPKHTTVMTNLTTRFIGAKGKSKILSEDALLLPKFGSLMKECGAAQAGDPFGSAALRGDVYLHRVSWDGGAVVVLRSGEELSSEIGTRQGRVQLCEIACIRVQIAHDVYEAGGDSTAHLIFRTSTGSECSVQIPVRYPIHTSRVSDDGQTAILDILSFETTLDSSAVLQHLNDNSPYYTMRVVQSLSEFDYAELLSSFRFEGRPLVNQVDLKPIAISGDCLVFRLNPPGDAEAQIEDWKKRNGFDREEIQFIPLGTSGVFAEAVQGRANAAEKLDLTRFWNWQDSPIPIVAPEIAAIQAGSRAAAADVRPGGLEQPLVSIVSPAALPAPTGMPAIISALASGNIFRDMSGIAQGAQLAQSSLEQAMQGATAAGEGASANLQAGLTLTKAILSQIVAMNERFATLLYQTGMQAMQNLGNASITNAGAAVNYGEKLDDAAQATRQAAGQAAGSGSSTGGASTPPGAEGGGTGSTSDAGAGTQPSASTANSRSNAQAAFDNVVGNPARGGSQGSTAAGGGNSGSPTSSGSARTTDEAVPLDPSHTVPSLGIYGQSIGPSALEVADIILTTSEGNPVSDAIRAVTGAPVSHTILYVGDGLVVEAIASGVVLRPLAEAVESATLAVAFRHPYMTEELGLRVKDYAGVHVGDSYDYAGIVRQAAFRLLPRACERLTGEGRQKCQAWVGKVNLGTGDNSSFLCSELVLAAYQNAGLPLTATPPHWSSPGEIAELQSAGILAYVGHLKTN